MVDGHVAVLPDNVGGLGGTRANNIVAEEGLVNLGDKLLFSVHSSNCISIVNLVNILNLLLFLGVTEVFECSVLAFLSLESDKSGNRSD